MHVDRRKSDVDLIEHVIGGVRTEHMRAASDDRSRTPRVPPVFRVDR